MLDQDRLLGLVYGTIRKIPKQQGATVANTKKTDRSHCPKGQGKRVDRGGKRHGHQTDENHWCHHSATIAAAALLSGEGQPVFFNTFLNRENGSDDFSRQGESLRLIPSTDLISVSTSSWLSQDISCS